MELFTPRLEADPGSSAEALSPSSPTQEPWALERVEAALQTWVVGPLLAAMEDYSIDNRLEKGIP